jgi:hypothetical protein
MSYKLLAIFISLLAITTAAPYGDFCKQHECFGKTDINTSIPLAAIPTESVEHKLVDGVFVYYTYISFTVDATNETSLNKLTQVIKISGLFKEPCGNRWCFMGVIFKSSYPIDWRTEGYYIYQGLVLSFHPTLYFNHPAHNVSTVYTLAFMTCILDPLKPNVNPCLDQPGGMMNLYFDGEKYLMPKVKKSY